MMIKRILGILLCCLMTIALLIGCSGGSDQQSEPKLLLGFSQLGSESAWRIGNTNDIEKQAANFGVSLMLENANQKQENQIDAIRRFIAYRVDVIAFSPIVEEGWDNVNNVPQDYQHHIAYYQQPGINFMGRVIYCF